MSSTWQFDRWDVSRATRAERQIVAGSNYRLCLDVTIAGRADAVQALIFRNLEQRFQLT